MKRNENKKTRIIHPTPSDAPAFVWLTVWLPMENVEPYESRPAVAGVPAKKRRKRKDEE